MKKYKLLKWFPTLPKDWVVGMELGVGENRICNYSPCSSKYKDYYLLPADVENNPEFFEEIIEKEYEILSLKAEECPEFTFVLRENGLYSTKEKGSQTLESLLYHNWKIFSIKRLSDNEVFSIGDELVDTFNRNQGKFTLKEIEFEIALSDKGTGKLTFVHTHLILGKWILLERLEKAKPVLFVTEDFFSVFEGDFVYIIYTPLTSTKPALGNPFKIPKDWKPTSYQKTYYLKEVAQEFILMNKPVLSINDVLDFLEHKTLKPLWNWDRTTPSFERDIKELVKSKL